jgi:hypothetical protein
MGIVGSAQGWWLRSSYQLRHRRSGLRRSTLLSGQERRQARDLNNPANYPSVKLHSSSLFGYE